MVGVVLSFSVLLFLHKKTWLNIITDGRNCCMDIRYKLRWYSYGYND